MNIAPYRKAVVAAVAAIVTIAQTFGFPVAEELTDKFVAVFDSVAAFLVYWVPNEA